jgi:hypothetical protein
MRAMQYNGYVDIQQESVLCVLQSKMGLRQKVIISQLRSNIKSLTLGFVLVATMIFPVVTKAEPPVLELPITARSAAPAGW